MTVKTQINAAGYRLTYLPDEDRLLVCVNLQPACVIGMQMTRRLTRGLIAALVKMVSERGAPQASDPRLRDTILDFEHSQQVAAQKAEGNLRDVKNEAPPILMRQVKEVHLAPKPEGGLTLLFDNAEQVIAVDVQADRLHMVIETFVQMAERAGWDFPPMAAWLDAPKAPAPKTVN